MFGKRKLEILPEDRVKLPAVFGVRPGRYLTAAYGAAALFVLFMILLYPGLSKPGVLVLAVSEPSGAAFRVDGVTLGTTPCEVFLPAGKRGIEMILPGFESYGAELDLRGRLFGSLLFPKKITLPGTLSSPDPAAAFAAEAADFAFWALAGEPAETGQVPLSLSEGAYRVGPAAAKDPALAENINGILGASLRFAVTKAAARDLLRAKFLAGNGGLSPSPLTLVRSIREAAAAASAAPSGAAAAWLESLGADLAVPSERAVPPEQAASAITVSGGVPGNAFSLNGHQFLPVPEGTITAGGVTNAVPAMYAASAETARDSWDAFVAENPRWAAENREILAGEGLVSAGYLVSVSNGAYPDPAVPGVSWYAAGAYCAWLEAKLPPALAGWEARLPSEAEWEYAALYLGGFSGGLWEWCADFYVPLNFFPAPAFAAEALGSPERSVRGGSWINAPGSTGPETRGSLPPDSSTPFTGFRPVLVPSSR